jgi:hypothetical protein
VDWLCARAWLAGPVEHGVPRTAPSQQAESGTGRTKGWQCVQAWRELAARHGAEETVLGPGAGGCARHAPRGPGSSAPRRQECCRQRLCLRCHRGGWEHGRAGSSWPVIKAQWRKPTSDAAALRPTARASGSSSEVGLGRPARRRRSTSTMHAMMSSTRITPTTAPAIAPEDPEYVRQGKGGKVRMCVATNLRKSTMHLEHQRCHRCLWQSLW